MCVHSLEGVLTEDVTALFVRRFRGNFLRRCYYYDNHHQTLDLHHHDLPQINSKIFIGVQIPVVE